MDFKYIILVILFSFISILLVINSFILNKKIKYLSNQNQSSLANMIMLHQLVYDLFNGNENEKERAKRMLKIMKINLDKLQGE